MAISWLATAGSLLAGAAGTVGNWIRDRNQFAYDKWVQQETWNREDNAVQRRKDDLIKAGLSPVLAAGSAAQTSTPIRAQVPSPGPFNAAAEAMQFRTALMREKQDIATSAAQEKLNQMQTDNAALSTLPLRQALNSNVRISPSTNPEAEFTPAEFLGRQYLYQTLKAWEMMNSSEIKASADADYSIAQAKLAETNSQQAQHDLEITKKMGVRSYDSGVNGALEAVIRALGGSGTPYASALSDVLPKLLKAVPLKGVPNYVR